MNYFLEEFEEKFINFVAEQKLIKVCDEIYLFLDEARLTKKKVVIKEIFTQEKNTSYIKNLDIEISRRELNKSISLDPYTISYGDKEEGFFSVTLRKGDEVIYQKSRDNVLKSSIFIK